MLGQIAQFAGFHCQALCGLGTRGGFGLTYVQNGLLISHPDHSNQIKPQGQKMKLDNKIFIAMAIASAAISSQAAQSTAHNATSVSSTSATAIDKPEYLHFLDDQEAMTIFGGKKVSEKLLEMSSKIGNSEGGSKLSAKQLKELLKSINNPPTENEDSLQYRTCPAPNSHQPCENARQSQQP